MSRRTLTLLLSTSLALVLTLLAFVVPVPFVLLSGGPIYNTTGGVPTRDAGEVQVITISGREVFPTDGRLDLTTVSVDRSITVSEAIRGWFSGDDAVAPTEIYFPADQTEEQIREESTQQMVVSQSAAKTAALVALGIPVTVTVSAVEAGSAADGQLRPGDDVTAVDGRPVTSPTVLQELFRDRPAGAPVTVTVRREGATQDVTFASGRSAEAPAVAVTDYPFDIDIALEDVGGPSAGLMFALGIIDLLGPESLTQGRHLAGTGEITPDGAVGPIGGIQQKMAAAREERVDVFLVPTDNCADAEANRPDGLQLVRVTTLQSALDALTTISRGGTPPDCT